MESHNFSVCITEQVMMSLSFLKTTTVCVQGRKSGHYCALSGHYNFSFHENRNVTLRPVTDFCTYFPRWPSLLGCSSAFGNEALFMNYALKKHHMCVLYLLNHTVTLIFTTTIIVMMDITRGRKGSFSSLCMHSFGHKFLSLNFYDIRITCSE